MGMRLKILFRSGHSKIQGCPSGSGKLFSLVFGQKGRPQSKLFLFTSLASRCHLDDQIEEENEEKWEKI